MPVEPPLKWTHATMEKFLIFDVDKSLAALGGKSQIIDLCGGIEPLPVTDGIMQIKGLLDKLFVTKVVERTHPLFETKFSERVCAQTELCVKQGLRGIVIDTISHSFNQDKRILEKANKSGALEMQDWGKLERMYSAFLSLLVNLPVWVIVNCHITYDKDQSTGTFYFAPQVGGATKDNMPQYFDVVLFTKVARAESKKAYNWSTKADSSKFAKDRLDILPPIVEQNFAAILRAYREAGIQYPKIMVVGESGTGKSKALNTINAK